MACLAILAQRLPHTKPMQIMEHEPIAQMQVLDGAPLKPADERNDSLRRREVGTMMLRLGVAIMICRLLPPLAARLRSPRYAVRRPPR